MLNTLAAEIYYKVQRKTTISVRKSEPARQRHEEINSEALVNLTEAAAALEAEPGPDYGTTLLRTRDREPKYKTDNIQLQKQDTLCYQEFPHEQCSLKWDKFSVMDIF